MFAKRCHLFAFYHQNNDFRGNTSNMASQLEEDELAAYTTPGGFPVAALFFYVTERSRPFFPLFNSCEGGGIC
jgi:hypothetical protein